ncbi:MAG: zinc-ribbon domain-containing protein [Lachnospiraceae bacterium]|nr:zinc-ribbon domain-containing protein [Lachnospiraceae bacterium]
MIKCPMCNKELEDDAKFCDECGTPIPEMPQQEAAAEPEMEEAKQQTAFCPNCGKPLPADSLFCDECGANLSAVSGVDNVNYYEETEQQGGKNGKKTAVLAVIIALCILVAAGVIALLKAGSGSNDSYALYVKEKELFYSNLKKSLQVSDKFIDDSNISNLDVANAAGGLAIYIKKSENGKYLFFPDRINDEDDGFSLYYNKISNLDGDNTKIDSGVLSYEINDDASYVTYLKEGDTLYSYNIKKADKEKVSADVEGYAVSEDGKQIYYVNDEGTLYLWTMGKDKEKVDSDIYRVVSISDDFKTVYYIKGESIYRKVQTKEREKLASDVSSVLYTYDSGCIYYLKDVDTEFTMDMFVVDDMDNDYISSELEEYTPNLNLYMLCYYDGDEENELGYMRGGYYSVAAGEEAVAFLTVNPEEFEKVKLSKVYNDNSLWEIAYSVADDASSYVLAQGSKLITLDIDIEEIYDFCINSDGNKIMYLCDYDYEDSEGDLYMITVKNGKVSSQEELESDVYYYGYGFVGDSYLYYVDVKDGKGDLYIDGEEVAYDTYIWSGVMDSDVYYYYTDYDYDKEKGTLNSYENGKTVKIADDVHDFELLENGNVLVLDNYSLSKYRGELHLYTGSKLKAMDDDVVCILGSNADYVRSIYYYYGSRE